MQYRVETLIRLSEPVSVVDEDQAVDATAFSVVHGIEAGSREEACALASQAAMEIRMGIGGNRLVSGRVVTQKAELAPPPSWDDDCKKNFHVLDEYRCFFHGDRCFHQRLPKLKQLTWRLHGMRQRCATPTARMTRNNTPQLPAWMQLPSPQLHDDKSQK